MVFARVIVSGECQEAFTTSTIERIHQLMRPSFQATNSLLLPSLNTKPSIPDSDRLWRTRSPACTDHLHIAR